MTNIRQIGSKSNPLLIRLRKRLSDPAYYRKTAEVVLEGDHLCRSWLQGGGNVPHALVTTQAWQQDDLRSMAMRADTVSVLSAELMLTVTTLESAPPVMFVLPWKAGGVIEPDQPTVVLDRLQDAGNVGTLIRSAAAFGITQLLALKGSAALWSPKVLRAGMGAHFALNLVEGLEQSALSQLRVPLLGTSSHSALAIHTTPLPWPCAWIFGHEGQGVCPQLLERCALTVTIPQPGGEESLNVGVAAAVCLYESARQRM